MYITAEEQYLSIMRNILTNGDLKADRTGTGTLSTFGQTIRVNLQKEFPLYTTKKIPFRLIAHELLWFLKGDTNVKYLEDNNVKIWREWADINGDLGPVYGKQWVDWVDTYMTYNTSLALKLALQSKGYYFEGYVQKNGQKPPACIYRRSTNQIQKVMDLLKNDPDSRRIYVTSMNVGELDQMALEPCHNYFQFTTTELSLYERFELFRHKNYKFGVDYMLTFNPENGEIAEPEKLKKQFDESDIPTRKLNCFFLMRKHNCAF